MTMRTAGITVLGVGLVLAGCAGTPERAGPALGLMPPAAGRAAPLDTAAIEAGTGLKGTLFEKEPGGPVFKVTQARADVPISVEGRRMEAFTGFTSWAGFQAGQKAEAVLAGDLVLFPDEVSPVMDALLAHACNVTAVHNHFAFEEPRVMFMHIGGEGKTADLAAGVRAALDAVRGVRAKRPDPRSAGSFDDQAIPAASSITPGPLDAVFFPDAKEHGMAKDGLYKVVLGRDATMACGCRIGKEMGVNTWAAFCGSNEASAVAGDFACVAGELQPVLHALRSAHINIVAIHSHMEGETPAYLFLHFWGKGRAEDLARGVKSALVAQKAAGTR